MPPFLYRLSASIYNRDMDGVIHFSTSHSARILAMPPSDLLGIVLIVRHGDRHGFYQNLDTYAPSLTSITPLGEVCRSFAQRTTEDSDADLCRFKNTNWGSISAQYTSTLTPPRISLGSLPRSSTSRSSGHGLMLGERAVSSSTVR